MCVCQYGAGGRQDVAVMMWQDVGAAVFMPPHRHNTWPGMWVSHLGPPASRPSPTVTPPSV